MKVLIKHDYAVSKKEPYGAFVRRIHDAVVQAEMPVSYEFGFSDSPVAGGVSAISRAVKKFPQLAALVQPETGGQMIAGGEADLPFDVLAQVADGLPRSLPFNAASVQFSGPGLGTVIAATDSWWINGRNRALSVRYVIEVERMSKTLPAPEGPLGALLAALGKPKKTNQYPLPETEPEAPSGLADLTHQIRARLPQLVEQAALPHSLPPLAEALANIGHHPHPLKPTLERFFRPLGYSCKGGSGTFSLRRRSAGNHVVEVDLDVGTWSRSVTAFYKVHVPGARCSFGMPVGPGMGGGQYPIGDATQWEKIVENLAVLAAHLDREVVPEIAAAAGPAPEWFEAPA